ncbi:helix-turn-helix domain-containing protein [Actinomadura sp. SCN-SB]|uniref:helix-turn-helix domain-containing protein n=1 Tax=Actinomadura sp. SCN-SB TaxID=3373092 RepID=UPI0037529144
MGVRAEIGQRIARQRRRRGLSQVVVAGLVGRSESWLSQVERGRRSIDSHAVLVRLAEVLDVDISQLTTEESDAEMAKYERTEAIRAALLRYDSLPELIGPGGDQAQRPRLSWLSQELRRVNRLYQATRYEEAGRLLPGLIIAAERAGQTKNGDDRRAALTLCSLVYQSVAMTLNRVGEADLALMAADRSLSAARLAERSLLTAVGAYRLGYVLIRLKRAREAEDLALRARDALVGSLRRPYPLVQSIRGGLCLVAATAAASRFDRAAVDSHLRSAREVADLIGTDRNDFWSAFGPTNVVIHEVSAAVTFGDAKLAVSRGESLDLDHLGPGLLGRRAQVSLDLARAYALQRKDAAAVNTLLQAERLSPELIKYDARTNDLLTELVRREHRASTPELRGLAHRAGVV